MARILFTILLSCLASSTLAQGKSTLSLDYNYQRPGGDYSNFIARDIETCVQECEKSTRCQAFDFYQSDNSCWLKSTTYPSRRYTGVISGVKKRRDSGGTTVVPTHINLNYDTQRPGADYTRFPVQNARKCAQECAADTHCSAFDYTTSDSFCYLKSWTPPARYYRGIISGVKQRIHPRVQSVQQALTQQHYNPGPADGLMGRKTKIALEKYQRDHHLTVSGEINNDTLISLGLLQAPAPGESIQVEATPTDTQSSPAQTTPGYSSEERQTETSDKVETKPFHTYVKTSGVTYLQRANTIYADILAKIPAGTILQVLSESSEWYKVSYLDQVGYVLAEAVEKQ